MENKNIWAENRYTELKKKNLNNEQKQVLDSTTKTKKNVIPKEWQDIGNVSGIYIILNKINNNWYVGSAVDVKKRWRHHKFSLKNNCHRNSHLQRSYNSHGIETFEFHLIEMVSQKDLIIIEQKYLDYGKLHCRNMMYNTSEFASNPMLGRKHTEKHCKYMSKIMLGKNLGRKHTLEACHNISVNNTGKKKSISHCQNISINRMGMKFSKEHCKNISNYVSNNPPCIDRKIYHFTNEITNKSFAGIRRDFEKEFGIKIGYLFGKSKRLTHLGWRIIT